MRRPLPRVIAVAVLFLSIAAPWLFFQGNQTAAYGFSNFASAIVDAKTAKFQLEVTIEGIPPQKSQVFYLAPGKFRLETAVLGIGSVVIADDATGSSMTLVPLTKTAMMATSKGRTKEAAESDPFLRIRKLLADSKDSKDKVFKPCGEKEFNGKKATGFRSETAGIQVTLWGDPATGHPVRVEAVWSGSPRNETVMTDFEINVNLDQSIFEMKAPPDYKVQTIEVDLSKPAEQDLIEAFKLCTEISQGKFPDSMGLLGTTMFLATNLKGRFKNASEEEMLNAWKEVAPVTRGFRFALEMPTTAEATYAGKGLTKDDANKPIFWYKPKDTANYRVLYADLSIKESDTAPTVPGAERLNATQSAKPDQK
jgi:outer membrane lipoprotein-sorting protein